LAAAEDVAEFVDHIRRGIVVNALDVDEPERRVEEGPSLLFASDACRRLLAEEDVNVGDTRT
jgi:hypothetical protein